MLNITCIRPIRNLLRSTTAAAVVVGLTALAGAAEAAPAPLSCGSVVNRDVRLTSDLVDCPGPGLIIGASDITVDLAGHTVNGTGRGAGIDNQTGHDRLHIRNGIVRDFAFGIHLFDTTGADIDDVSVEANQIGVEIERSRRVDIHRLTATANAATGMEITFSERTHIRDSRATGNGLFGFVDRFSAATRFERNTLTGNAATGLSVDRTSGAIIRHNTAEGNGDDGIALSGTGDAFVAANEANGNANDGVELDTPGNTLRRNSARNNGGFGINAVSGTIDGGRNEASGNVAGDCTGVGCR